MKKNILLFFILFTIPLFAEKIIIPSEFFSKNKDFIRFIEDNLDNKKELKKNIDRYFIQKGYIFTRVDRITINEKTGEITIRLHEGEIMLFTITGNRHISDKLITSYLYFRIGDIFNKKNLQLQIKKMYDTDLFDSIQYDINREKQAVFIKITEKKRIYFDINGNYTSRYGAMPYLGLINRRLFNRPLYMELNGECGFRDRLNYYKFNLKFNAHGIYLDTFHRNGRTFINENDYSSREEKISVGMNFYSSKYINMFFLLPFENYWFYDTKKFDDMRIISGIRYGSSFLFSYNNKRDVIDIREESMLAIKLNNIFFSGMKNYFKCGIDLKGYQLLFSGAGIVYKNSTGIIDKTAPFDQLFLIGGDNQRGYPEGLYMTALKFENSLEIEYELIFNILRLVLFTDTSCFQKNNNYAFIQSYGPGIIFNISIFNIQAFFGIPADKNISNGLFYINLKRIIY